MPGRPLVRRRTALAGALGTAAALLASGCDTGDDIGDQPSGSATPEPAGSASTAPDPEQTPDQALVDQVLEQLTGAFGVLVTARRFPPLRTALAPVVKAHRRHVEVLEGEVGGWVAPALSGPAVALKAVRRSETRLQAALVDAAGRAESGALAKLLASMSASVTQHLAALPEQA